MARQKEEFLIIQNFKLNIYLRKIYINFPYIDRKNSNAENFYRIREACKKPISFFF